MAKIAIVTGSNKGIGFAIVKGLCENFDGTTYLTCRNKERGDKAIKALKDIGFNPEFHQLDVDDEDSVLNFHDFIKEKHGGIDLLVNNAAIAFSNDATEPAAYQAEQTVKTNYFGLLKVCNGLFPLLRRDAVVVNVSSSAGHLSRIPSADLRKQFSDVNLTVDQLSDLMRRFVNDAKDGSHVDKGWGNSTYVVSKVGVTALTRVQQKLFDEADKNVTVNAVHPGYVDTDMTNHKGPLTIEQGASAPLYLALEPHGLKGQYVWHNKAVVDWLAPSPPKE